MPLALLDNVTKIYADDRAPALKNVTLGIEAGELVLLHGPAGAGKTTLLKILACLEKPTEGKVYLDSKNISRLRPDLLAEVRRRDIGYLTSEADLIPIFSVFENVELPLQLLKQGKAGERREKVRQLLDELGLGGAAGKKPRDLLPLERQKVALAAALVKSPALILADEPTAKLDLKSALEFLGMIVEINKKRKTSFLVASDDLALSRYLPKVFKLYGGVIEGTAPLPAPAPDPLPAVNVSKSPPPPFKPVPDAQLLPKVEAVPKTGGIPVYELKVPDLQNPLIKPPEARGKNAL